MQIAPPLKNPEQIMGQFNFLFPRSLVLQIDIANNQIEPEVNDVPTENPFTSGTIGRLGRSRFRLFDNSIKMQNNMNMGR